ncbi:MAG: DUF4388 domain-containing protein [Deinococcales bacterium]
MSTLSGALEKEQLFSLLSYLKLTNASGRLEIKYGQEDANIYFENGEVIHAEAGVLLGQHAIRKITSWAGGRFGFHPGERSPRASIDTSLEGLALSIAVAEDEGVRDFDQGVDLDCHARMVRQLEGEMTLSADELMFLPRLTGTTTLRQIGQALGWSEHRTRTVVAALSVRGLLQVAKSSAQIISSKFTSELSKVYLDLLGPAGTFLYADVCRDLNVDLAQLPASRFSEVMRALADSIGDNATRERFVQALVQLRSKYGI